MNAVNRIMLAAMVAELLTATTALWAQSQNRQVGTPYTVTADPLVPRPPQPPCVVPLFSNYTFAHFADTIQSFTFAPPAGCAGPWEKIVFEIDFSENPGVQFDRTASVYINNANLYFGTTPEPLASLTNTWHVERDITDYAALLESSQPGTIVLQNCTSDCPPPYDTFLNGVFTVSANLEFYPARWRRGLPAAADLVLPLVQSNGQGGVNLPDFLYTPSDQLTTTFSLPTNVEQAYLDVVAQSQFDDEQWYACFPNNLSSINEVYGCGNTDFRETEVTIDGQPAGIAPVSPWVFTGFLPDEWVPIPGAQTLDFVPYRVNLTPFAGLLSNGQPHTIALSVFDDDDYFSVSASLLLYLDAASTKVSGAVTRNTLTPPSPAVFDNLAGTTTVTGTITAKSQRQYTIAGYVQTSHGTVSTAVSAQQNFSGTQTIDFDTVDFSVLDQNTSVETSLSSLTTVSSDQGITVIEENYRFPITVDLIYPVTSSPFGLTVATTQKYESTKLIWRDRRLEDFRLVTNSVSATDAGSKSSSQQYTSFGFDTPFYSCEIASADNELTLVSPTCGPRQGGDPTGRWNLPLP
ncbi:MAG TPA: peptide-N4-asparagine amidase [Terriglobales bacterium]|nr:peptide-N4-asparagine amidase [Terriglobales bacterium]